MDSEIIQRDFIADLKKVNNNMQEFAKTQIFLQPAFLDFDFCKHLIEKDILDLEALLKFCNKHDILHILFKNTAFIDWLQSQDLIQKEHIEFVFSKHQTPLAEILNAQPEFLKFSLENDFISFKDILTFFKKNAKLDDFLRNELGLSHLLKDEFVSKDDFQLLFNLQDIKNSLSNKIASLCGIDLMSETQLFSILLKNKEFNLYALMSTDLNFVELLEEYKKRGIDDISEFFSNFDLQSQLLMNNVVDSTEFFQSLNVHHKNAQKYLKTWENHQDCALCLNLYNYIKDKTKFSDFMSILKDSDVARRRFSDLLEYDVDYSDIDLLTCLGKPERRNLMNI